MPIADFIALAYLIFLGHGVFVAFDIRKNRFLFQYPGDLISLDKVGRREKRYVAERKGYYLYHFTVGEDMLW